MRHSGARSGNRRWPRCARLDRRPDAHARRDGLDSKVGVSLVSPDGKAAVALTPDDQRRIGDFFNRYKRHEPGKFSKVPGWGGAVEGLA